MSLRRVVGPLAGAGLLLAGCQEPFERRRGDLGPFRIAAVGVTTDGRARAAIYSGAGPWHETPPTLAWSADGEALGEGPTVDVPADAATLSLVATSVDGVVEEAVLDVAPGGLDPWPVREAVDLSGDLSLDARRAVEGAPVDTAVPAGHATRIHLSAPDDAADPDLLDEVTLRWMTAEGEGTLLELDVLAADALREEVVFEDGELLSREDLGPGRTTHLALALSGDGRNGWRWIDTVVGEDVALWRHEGWLLEGEVDVSTGLVAATLLRDPDGRGLRLDDPVPVADLADVEVPACADGEPAFRLAWLAEGRCGLAEVVGARVGLTAW